MEHFDRVLLVAPGWGAVQVHRGRALHALGRTAEALEALCTATAMEPANAEAWSFLGFLRLSQYQAKAALDCCDRALALRPLSFLEGQYPNARQAPWRPGRHERGPDDRNRVRLVYVSADFSQPSDDASAD